MKLGLPAGVFGAYLFDCDGTIADSMPLHYVAWKKSLWGNGIVRSTRSVILCVGRKDGGGDYSGSLNEQQGLSMPVERGLQGKEELYRELLPQLKAVPEVMRAY